MADPEGKPMDDDDDDVDWGEAERRARMWDHIGEVMERMRNRKYVPVRLDKLAPGLRFIVTTYSEGHEPLDFTLLEPKTGRVRVSDNFYFPEPTESVLVGSEDDLDGGGAMLPGVVKHNAKLVIEVNGKRIEENGPELRVMRLLLHIPGTAPLNPWSG
jgi:hypothetical protein